MFRTHVVQNNTFHVKFSLKTLTVYEIIQEVWKSPAGNRWRTTEWWKKKMQFTFRKWRQIYIQSQYL